MDTLILIIIMISLLILVAYIFLKIDQRLRKIEKTIAKYNASISDYMKRITIMFESTNQRIIVINNRFRNYCKAFGIDVAQDMTVPSHYIKNNAHKNKGKK